MAVAGGASTDTFVAPHFSGTPHTQNLAAKLRLECVVGADLVPTVKEIVFAHEGKRSFLYVLAVDEVHPPESVILAGAAGD